MSPVVPRWLAGAVERAPERRALSVAALLGVALLAASLTGDGLFAPMLRGLAVVVALGVAVALVRRRSPAPGAAAEIAVLERRALAKDAGVALVEVAGQHLLVGYAPGGVALVARLPRAGEAP
jgi:flagellar biogenesis protein FliO